MQSNSGNLMSHPFQHVPPLLPLTADLAWIEAKQVVGRTIKNIAIGRTTERNSHSSDVAILEFTDGTFLKIETHSNAGNLATEYEAHGMKPSDVHTNLYFAAKS